MIVDAHAHIFPQFRGRVAAGPVEGRGYGRIAIGGRIVQGLPPCGERTEFTAEMLIAHMDWARVDKAVLLQGPYYGECNEYVQQALTSHDHYTNHWGSRGCSEMHHWGHYPVADLQFVSGAAVSMRLRAWTPSIPRDVAAASTLQGWRTKET